MHKQLLKAMIIMIAQMIAKSNTYTTRCPLKAIQISNDTHTPHSNAKRTAPAHGPKRVSTTAQRNNQTTCFIAPTRQQRTNNLFRTPHTA